METSAIVQLSTALPGILISIVAITLAAFRLRRHALVSIAAMLAFTLHIASVLVGVAYQNWLMAQARQGVSPPDFTTSAAIFGSLQLVANLAFLILITIAIFAGRSPRPDGVAPVGTPT